MEGARLRLTGVGEGLEVQVTTSLRGADSPSAVAQALSALFPDARPEQLPPEPSFGSAVRADWTFENVPMQTFLTQLHEQRILDTALDAMAKNLHGNQTVFSVSRLAALAGKIAFPIPGELPLGGVFTITLTGTGLQEWLQAATWHAGRSQVPRSIQDERAMDDDGEASTWL